MALEKVLCLLSLVRDARVPFEWKNPHPKVEATRRWWVQSVFSEFGFGVRQLLMACRDCPFYSIKK